MAAASMATAVPAAPTLPSLDEYLSMVKSLGLDFGGHKDASDDSDYCIIVQSGNPSLTPLLGNVRRRMLNKLAKRTPKGNVQSSLSAIMHVMIKSVVEKRAYLLGPASQADKTVAFLQISRQSTTCSPALSPKGFLQRRQNPKVLSTWWMCGTSSRFYSHW
jgi:hypothetical protein